MATGGTLAAVGKLVESTGATLVGFGSILELAFLNPRAVLETPEHEVWDAYQGGLTPLYPSIAMPFCIFTI